jgi:uncharacterized membrane protein YidH (DUF202 family)
MAWSRTSLAFAVCTLLLVRLGVRSGVTPAQGAAIALGALTWAGFGLLARRRIRALTGYEPAAAAVRVPAGVAACVVAMAVYGFALVI